MILCKKNLLMWSIFNNIQYVHISEVLHTRREVQSLKYLFITPHMTQSKHEQVCGFEQHDSTNIETVLKCGPKNPGLINTYD